MDDVEVFVLEVGVCCFSVGVEFYVDVIVLCFMWIGVVFVFDEFDVFVVFLGVFIGEDVGFVFDWVFIEGFEVVLC